MFCLCLCLTHSLSLPLFLLDIKPEQCNECGRGFAQKVSLNDHLRKHHRHTWHQKGKRWIVSSIPLLECVNCDTAGSKWPASRPNDIIECSAQESDTRYQCWPTRLKTIILDTMMQQCSNCTCTRCSTKQMCLIINKILSNEDILFIYYLLLNQRHLGLCPSTRWHDKESVCVPKLLTTSVF